MNLEKSTINAYQEIIDIIQEKGIDSIEVNYHGMNDEGNISSVDINYSNKDQLDDDDLKEKVSNFSYDLLEDTHPGWEVDYGSNGNIKISSSGIELNHGNLWEDKSHFEESGVLIKDILSFSQEAIDILKENNVDLVSFHYSGSGDSGEVFDVFIGGEIIEDIEFINEDIKEKINAIGVSIIELYHSGFEINEGGGGVINLKTENGDFSVEGYNIIEQCSYELTHIGTPDEIQKNTPIKEK